MLGMERNSLSWESWASRVMGSGSWGAGVRGIGGQTYPDRLPAAAARGIADRPAEPGEGAVAGGALHQLPEVRHAGPHAPPMAPVPAVEPVEVGAIDPDPHQRGVVDGPLGEPAHPHGAQLGAERTLELFPRPAPDRDPAGLERIAPGLPRIERLQAVQQLLVEAVEHDLVVPAVGGAGGQGRVPPAPEELLRGPVAHQLGEALVERRGALHVKRVMRDLVEDERGQLHRVPDHRGGQERVLEPAERPAANFAAARRAAFTSKYPLYGIRPTIGYFQVYGQMQSRGETERTRSSVSRPTSLKVV